jgi:hypothetical protein
MSQSVAHQHKRAYAVLNATTTRTTHVRSKYHSTYTSDNMIQALQAYTAVTKTRQQSKKSMRQIAYDNSVPYSTFKHHVRTHINQISMIAHPINNNTDIRIHLIITTTTS